MMCILYILIAFYSITNYAADKSNEERRILLNACTDHDDASSVRSASFDNTSLTDDQWQGGLQYATTIVSVSAQNNAMISPKPVYCPYLTQINFNGGTITTLNLGEWLQTMPSLESLNLANNKISSIANTYDAPNGSCLKDNDVENKWQSKSLKTLDVSHNELTIFDLNIPNNICNLTTANYSHNNISTVIIPKLLNYREMCTVDLSNNLLDKLTINLLKTATVCDSLKYGRRRGTGACCGLLLSAIPLAAIDTAILSAIINSGIDISGFGPFLLCVSTICLELATCTLLGCKIGECTLPKSERTYQPFAFGFTHQKSIPETIISMNTDQ